MKYILVLSLIFTSSLAIAQNYTLQKVEYSSMTRGHSESLEINKDSVIQLINDRINNGNSKKSKLTSDKEWKDLIKSINSIDLPKVGSFDSPSNKRQYDGARHSKIAIVTGSGTYSHLFDDENPHKQMSALMDCIVNIKGGLK